MRIASSSSNLPGLFILLFLAALVKATPLEDRQTVERTYKETLRNTLENLLREKRQADGEDVLRAEKEELEVLEEDEEKESYDLLSSETSVEDSQNVMNETTIEDVFDKLDNSTEKENNSTDYGLLQNYETLLALRQLENAMAKALEMAGKDSLEAEERIKGIQLNEQVENSTEPEEMSHLPKRQIFGGLGSAASAASAASAGSAGSAASAASAGSTASAASVATTPGYFSIPVLPVAVVDDITCVSEIAGFRFSHPIGGLVHQFFCELSKLFHYFVISFANLVREFSIGAELGDNVIFEEITPTNMAAFLNQGMPTMMTVLREPQYLQLLPDIMEQSILYDNISATICRLKFILRSMWEMIRSFFVVHFSPVSIATGFQEILNALGGSAFVNQIVTASSTASAGVYTVGSSAVSVATSTPTLLTNDLCEILSLPLDIGVNIIVEFFSIIRGIIEGFYISGLSNLVQMFSSNFWWGSEMSAFLPDESFIESIASQSVASTTLTNSIIPFFSYFGQGVTQNVEGLTSAWNYPTIWSYIPEVTQIFPSFVQFFSTLTPFNEEVIPTTSISSASPVAEITSLLPSAIAPLFPISSVMPAAEEVATSLATSSSSAVGGVAQTLPPVVAPVSSVTSLLSPFLSSVFPITSAVPAIEEVATSASSSSSSSSSVLEVAPTVSSVITPVSPVAAITPIMPVTPAIEEVATSTSSSSSSSVFEVAPTVPSVIAPVSPIAAITPIIPVAPAIEEVATSTSSSSSSSVLEVAPTVSSVIAPVSPVAAITPIMPVTPGIEEVTTTTTTTTTSSVVEVAPTVSSAIVPLAPVAPVVEEVATSASSSSSSSIVEVAPTVLTPIAPVVEEVATTASSSSSSSVTEVAPIVPSIVAPLTPIAPVVEEVATSTSSSSSTSVVEVAPTVLAPVAPVVEEVATSTSSSSSTSVVEVAPTVLAPVAPVVEEVATSSTSSSSSTSVVEVAPAISPVISPIAPVVPVAPVVSPVIRPIAPVAGGVSTGSASSSTSSIGRIPSLLPSLVPVGNEIASSASSSASSSVIETAPAVVEDVMFPWKELASSFISGMQAKGIQPSLETITSANSITDIIPILANKIRNPLSLVWPESLVESAAETVVLNEPLVLAREKIVQALGIDTLVPGDVVAINLENGTSLLGRVIDTVGPIIFDIISKIPLALIHTAQRIWTLLPKDFSDFECSRRLNELTVS